MAAVAATPTEWAHQPLHVRPRAQPLIGLRTKFKNFQPYVLVIRKQNISVFVCMIYFSNSCLFITREYCQDCRFVRRCLGSS